MTPCEGVGKAFLKAEMASLGSEDLVHVNRGVKEAEGQSFWGCGWGRNRIFDEAENQHNEAKGAQGECGVR